MKNLVFIIGTGRCGSSFVHEILAKHESVGFVSNIEDNVSFLNQNGRWNNTLYRSYLGQFTKKGGIRFAPSEAYQLITREISPIYRNSNRDLLDTDVSPWLRNGFCDFFEKRAEIQKKLIFSHKYTGWPRIRFFREIFPNAKFIHVIRDGRSVANSWLQMPWWDGYRGPENWQWGTLAKEYREEWEVRGRSYPHLAGILWKLLMVEFEKAEATLSQENYLKIRYEDILEQPKESFEKMLHFSGLEWTSKFEKQFLKQSIRKGRSRAFKKDLNTQQLAEIELSISDILLRYDYL